MRDRPLDLVTDRGQIDLREVQRGLESGAAAGRVLVTGAAWFQCAEGESLAPQVDLPNPQLTSPIPILTVPPPNPLPPPPYPVVQIVEIGGNTYLQIHNVFYLLVRVGPNPFLPDWQLTCFTEVLKVCPTKSGGNVTSLTMEVREVCLPSVLVQFGPIRCITDPGNCCATASGTPSGDCIVTACCPGGVKPSLTIADSQSGLSSTLTYMAGYLGYPAPGAWVGQIAAPDGPLLFTLYCDPAAGDWFLATSIDGGPVLLLEAFSVRCSPTVLQFQAPGGGVTTCAACVGTTASSWSISIAAAFRGLAGLLDPWTLTPTAGCVWAQAKADGSSLALTAAAGSLHLAYTGPTGSGASATFALPSWSGDCCADQVLQFTSAVGGDCSGHLRLTPVCLSSRPFTVAGGPCTTGGGGGTVSIPCCSTPVPASLDGTFLDFGGTCSCANGQSVTVAWDGSKWTGTGTICGHTCVVNLSPNPLYPSGNCLLGDVTFPDGCDNHAPGMPGAGFGVDPDGAPACSPFSGTSGFFYLRALCGCSADDGQIRLQFTPTP